MKRPDVILIMCDQWRPDCLGVLGHPLVKTPQLDALARSGVLFENAYCASPVCSPARASWLTGLYPHAHGQFVNYGEKSGRHVYELRPECVTLGDSFSAAGYRCGIIGPWHLGHDHLPQHGFENFWLTYNYQGKGRPNRLADYFARVGVPNLYDKKRDSRAGGTIRTFAKMAHAVCDDPRQQRTTWSVDRGLEFISSKENGGDPYFLFLSIKDPHPKMIVPRELLELYPREKIPLPPGWRETHDARPVYHRQARERIPDDASADDFRQMVAHYFALMTHVDRELGRIFSALEKTGKRNDTIVAFISDHGEMLGEHGFVGKRRFFEPAVRVPCIVSWPAGLPAGARIRTPLAGVNLAPTLLELAQVAPPARIDGRSVAGALKLGREPAATPVFAELATQEVHCGLTEDRAGLGGHVMIRDGRWKYIWSQFDLDELYDLAGDPGETTNLAAEPGQKERIRGFRRQIGAMVQNTGPGVYAWCMDPDRRPSQPPALLDPAVTSKGEVET